MRTASGTRHRDARYTDAPGYWFSVWRVRKKPAENLITAIRPGRAATGFYSYQTHDVLQPQTIVFSMAQDLGSYDRLLLSVQPGRRYAGYLRTATSRWCSCSIVRFPQQDR